MDVGAVLTLLKYTCKMITLTLHFAMKTLQIRLPNELRDQADSVLSEIGLDMPTAIRIYLNKIVHTRSIPFSLEAPSVSVEEISVDASTQKKMDAIAKVWHKKIS